MSAAQATACIHIHAILAGMEMCVERETEALGVVRIANELGDRVRVGCVEVYGGANGTRGYVGEKDRTLPSGRADRGKRKCARD